MGLVLSQTADLVDQPRVLGGHFGKSRPDHKEILLTPSRSLGRLTCGQPIERSQRVHELVRL